MSIETACRPNGPVHARREAARERRVGVACNRRLCRLPLAGCTGFWSKLAIASMLLHFAD